MKQMNINHFKNLNSDCLRGIDFYGQELDILQERLDEISKGNTGKEASEGIEHFQNQFIIHREQMDVLRHLLHENDQNIKEQILKTNTFVDVDIAYEHQELFDRYSTEEKIFNEMRHDFNLFAAKWM